MVQPQPRVSFAPQQAHFRKFHTFFATVSWDKIYAAEYDTFFKLCKGQQVSAPTGFEALHIMEVVEAARMSHSLGAHVTLPLWGL